jgi:hypothetical protein
MDGQGSGSSSSNAPAVMWHLLEFLNNQNGIEANQSALQNTQSALADRVNALELTGRVSALELTTIRNNQNGIEANQSALQNTQSALADRVSALELKILQDQSNLLDEIQANFSDSHRDLLDRHIGLLHNHREHVDSKMHVQNMDIEFLRMNIEFLRNEPDRLRDEIHEATEAGYKYINSRTPNTCYGCFTGLFDLLLRFINARRSLDGRFDAVRESLDRMRSYAKEDRNELIERISELEAMIEELRDRDNTRSNPNKRTNRACLRIRSNRR